MFDCIDDGVEDGNAFVRRAAFSRRNATNNVRSILNHLFGMKRTFFTGDALHDQARGLIDENTQLDILSPIDDSLMKDGAVYHEVRARLCQRSASLT